MIVVTGGAGFIGSNIAWALEDRRLGPVVVCDRLGDGDDAGAGGKSEKWRNLLKRDLTDVILPENLFSFLQEKRQMVRAVIHMGAISATTATDADEIMKNNYRLSMDLWRWCAEHRVRLIYASSAATYGDGGQGFDDDASPEALCRLRPLNLYGWSKHTFDRRVARMIADGEPAPPQWAGLKFFNVYGPNEYHKGGQQSVVAQVYAAIKRGEPAVLFRSHNPDYEDGGQLRDFIWVDDCVDVVLWLLENETVNGLFNCGTGQARTFLDLANAVFKALEQRPEIEFRPTPEAIREKYQYFTEGPMARLRAAGYDQDFTSLEDGVAQYVRGFLATNDRYR